MKKEIKITFEHHEDGHKKTTIIIDTPDSDKPEAIIQDMGLLCEALCTLIHSAHKEGIKKDHESLRTCIKHLEAGFSDETYKTESSFEKEESIV